MKFKKKRSWGMQLELRKFEYYIDQFQRHANNLDNLSNFNYIQSSESKDSGLLYVQVFTGKEYSQN